MTEIPEHLLKRSQEAKANAEGGTAPVPESGGASDDDGETIPRSLLEQSQQGGVAAPTSGGVATIAPPAMAGPSGNTHRLLTVVKSGSIQDVKANPGDKVHVWPHLLAAEFTAALFITAFSIVFSVFITRRCLSWRTTTRPPIRPKRPGTFLGSKNY